MGVGSNAGSLAVPVQMIVSAQGLFLSSAKLKATSSELHMSADVAAVLLPCGFVRWFCMQNSCNKCCCSCATTPARNQDYAATQLKLVMHLLFVLSYAAVTACKTRDCLSAKEWLFPLNNPTLRCNSV